MPDVALEAARAMALQEAATLPEHIKMAYTTA